MKALNLVTLVLVIVGGLNWGLVGLMDLNLVATLFGDGSIVSNLVYLLVGLSAVWQIVPLVRSFRMGEPRAEAGARPEA
jgi:uncharacterized membrane protein YuzA (DUF378 family)